MATEFATVKTDDNDSIKLIAFYGGDKKGRSLNLLVQSHVNNDTFSKGTCLTLQQVLNLKKQLDVFLNEEYK